MAARHLAEDFSEEYEDDYQSAYVTAAQGKHLRKPVVRYVPTIPEDYTVASFHEDVRADEQARSHVEEIYRELSVSHSKDMAQSQEMVLRGSRLSADLLPGFGPPQSQLAEFVPEIESVPGDRNHTTSEGVFARHQSASSTLVLNQQALHGLRRRISSRDHGQVDVAIERKQPSSFGYYAPQTTKSSKHAQDAPQQRKGWLGVIAEFFGRLFHAGN